MPRHLSIGTVIEKNKIAGDYAFLELLEVTVKDAAGVTLDTLRYVKNTEAITYQGNVYEPGAFDLEIENGNEETTRVRLMAYDFTQALQNEIEKYDGGVGFTIRLMIVNSGDLSQPADIDETFTVLGTSCKSFTVDFTLGARNPLLIRFPKRLQMRDRCSWRYKGQECGYAGPIPSCDYSLNGPNGCRAHNNERRFGGFPGLRPRNVP